MNVSEGRAPEHPRGLGPELGIRGKRVVVTGGSRGLGEQIVRLLVAEGASVATCARTAGDLSALAASLRPGEREQLYTRPLDVTEPDRLEEFVAAAQKRFGGLDGAVACAGGSRGGGLDRAEPADWAATWAVNVGHTVRLIRAAAPYLRAAGGGSVVVIASISGWKPAPGAQYGAAKSAQVHLAATLARELGPDGIRVNAVSPGSMLIPGRRWDRMRTERPEAFGAFVSAQLPTGRLVSAEEVARVVVFLLSDWSSGISGAHLPVDRAQNAPTPDGY